jgi:hypothetical protein
MKHTASKKLELIVSCLAYSSTLVAMLLRNVGWVSPDYTASHATRENSSQLYHTAVAGSRFHFENSRQPADDSWMFTSAMCIHPDRSIIQPNYRGFRNMSKMWKPWGGLQLVRSIVKEGCTRITIEHNTVGRGACVVRQQKARSLCWIYARCQFNMRKWSSSSGS